MVQKPVSKKGRCAFCACRETFFAKKRPKYFSLSTCFGQGSIEAAFLIPVLFVSLLLLIQPGILLYDRMVMNAAASEACRLLATKTDVLGAMDESCEAFVRHRLGCVPPIPCFHVHDTKASWEISFQGDESAEEVSVTIAHEVHPLPFIDVGSKLLGIVNERGNFKIKVVCHGKTQPAWVQNVKEGNNPAEWIGAWLS